MVRSAGVVLSSEAAEFFLVAADLGGDFLEGGAEVGDLGGEPGQGGGFSSAGAVLFDDGAEVGVAVEGGSAEPGAGGDGVEGDRVRGVARGRRRRPRRVAVCRLVSSGLGLFDVGVQACDEAAVTFDFAAPAAGLGVTGEGFGVGSLRGQDR